jgi:hypothetical protein
VTLVADTRVRPRVSSLPARLVSSASRPCWSGPGRGRTRPPQVSSRSRSREHVLHGTPAVPTAAAIALDVLVALAPVLLPGARGSVAVLTFLVLPSVLVAGYGSRRLISVQSVVVVASCGVVLATAADPPVPTAATAISVTAAVLA